MVMVSPNGVKYLSHAPLSFSRTAGMTDTVSLSDIPTVEKASVYRIYAIQNLSNEMSNGVECASSPTPLRRDQWLIVLAC